MFNLRMTLFAFAAPAAALLTAYLVSAFIGRTAGIGGPLGLTVYIGVCVLVIGSGAFVWIVRMRERQRREWLRVMLRRIAAGVIITDARGAVTAMNDAAERMTGWREPDALGQPVAAVFRLVDTHTRLRVVNPVVKALYKGLPVGPSPDTTLVAKDGVERQICETAAPMRDDRGHVFGGALAFKDLTEPLDQKRSTVPPATSICCTVGLQNANGPHKSPAFSSPRAVGLERT